MKPYIITGLMMMNMKKNIQGDFMKATSKQRKAFGEILEQSHTFHVDYHKLQNFLSRLFDKEVLITEAVNGTSHKVTITKLPEEYELLEIEKHMKSGSFEYWRLYDVFGWLLHYGYVGTGTFIIDFNW